MMVKIRISEIDIGQMTHENQGQECYGSYASTGEAMKIEKQNPPENLIEHKKNFHVNTDAYIHAENDLLKAKLVFNELLLQEAKDALKIIQEEYVLYQKQSLVEKETLEVKLLTSNILLKNSDNAKISLQKEYASYKDITQKEMQALQEKYTKIVSEMEAQERSEMWAQDEYWTKYAQYSTLSGKESMAVTEEKYETKNNAMEANEAEANIIYYSSNYHH